jgi:hypothetical protein
MSNPQPANIPCSCIICRKQFTVQGIVTHHMRSHGSEREKSKFIGAIDQKHTLKQTNITTYDTNPKTCKLCNAVIPYSRRVNDFCSSSCSATYSNKTRVLSPEAKSNISEAAKQNAWRLQSYTEARKEKQPPYSKIYQKVCATCGLNFSSRWKTTLTCSSECRSTRHALFNHKQNKTFGKCGYFAGLWCASTWELAFVIYSIDQGSMVSRCPDHFEYEYNGKIKRYFPDFTIDGIIYEIKGQMTDDVPIKTNAVINAGRLINVLTKPNITPMLKYVKTKYGVTDLTTLYQTT